MKLMSPVRPLIANISCFSPAPTRCTTSLKPGQGCMAKKHLALVLMVDVVCVEQPQASWEERSMKRYVGLDVSVKETSICIVDEAGRICREMKVVSHPEDLLAVLCDPAWRLERV